MAKRNGKEYYQVEFEDQLAEAERVAALPDDKFEKYVDDILCEQMREDKRTARRRIMAICVALMISWCLGAACAAHTIGAAQ